jgi:hypothetical protein
MIEALIDLLFHRGESQRDRALRKGRAALLKAKKDTAWLQKRPLADKYDGNGDYSDSVGRTLE